MDGHKLKIYQIIMNLNKILALGLLAGCSAAAMAVPARPGLRTYQQPDGSEITLTLVGDEHFHTFLTTDGLTVERGEDGAFYYLTTDGLTDVAVHNPSMRQAPENAFVKSISARADLEALLEVNKESINARRAATVPTRAGKTQVPNTGSPRIPILLVQYKDVKFRDADPLSTFKDFFMTGESSARRYFEDQSNGKFTPQFDVYGPVTLASKRFKYGANQSGPGSDVGVGKMVAEAVKALDSEIDYSLYDNDQDGECDVMIVLYAGDGEAASTDSDSANAIWPCQWTLSGSDYGKALNFNNTVINKFAVFNELSGFDLRKIDGIGTFCHEFSHCLGLPDFYDIKYRFFGMGMWSLMDTGSYNNQCYTPCGYSAYEKAFMGWIDIEEGVRDKQYTLPVFNSKDASKDIAVRLTNDGDPDEYFILENRRKQGWDSYMPAEGLFIYHVTYDEEAWTKNQVNISAMQRMTPVPCDNNLRMDYLAGQYLINEKDMKGDLWPYEGNNEFTDSSKPAAVVNTGKYLGKPVTEITINPDGTASFWVDKDVSGVELPEITDFNGEVEYFTLHGVKVAAPETPGIYMVKKGNKIEKIVL